MLKCVEGGEVTKLFLEVSAKFSLRWQKSCQVFVNPSYRDHYVQIEESQRVVSMTKFYQYVLEKRARAINSTGAFS